MVVLAFRATDVPSPVATALAMPLANSCRIAGKISSLFFWKTKYCNYDLPKTLKRNFFKIEIVLIILRKCKARDIASFPI